MSNFSPYIYEINNLPLVTIKKIETLFDHFTFLNKPKERNVYKVSLAQLIHYLIDFGIGYNSVCITTLLPETNGNQEFASTMYVNRHETESTLRPATVVDLKEKLLGAIRTLIDATIQEDRFGATVVDTIYPKYIFTLDTKLTSSKLKQLTGKDYVEEEDFTNFPFTNSTTSQSKITNANGLIPADSVLLCPNHNHGGTVNDTMKNAISYSWSIYLKPKGDTVWQNHGGIIYEYGGGFHSEGWDKQISPIWNGDCYSSGNIGEVNVPSFSPSWQFPTGVSCYANDPVYPTNNTAGGVTIRYPGRRYRLFKLVEA
jgi:hypothetical protein